MRIVLDFDHTLYSSKSLYEAIKAAFGGLGVSEDIFQQTFQLSKGKGLDYKPSRQMRSLAKQTGITEAKLQKAFDKVLRISPSFLYPDSVPFLKKYCKTAEIFMLSYGEEKFQRQKIDSAKINKHFKRVCVTGDISKSKNFKRFMKKGEKVIFVEDNPQALAGVKNLHPEVVTARMRRGEGKYAETPDNDQTDFQITDFFELEKIISALEK